MRFFRLAVLHKVYRKRDTAERCIFVKTFKGKFHLELSEPQVVVQGAVGDQAWGHYQFPTIGYTQQNNIFVSWSYGTDSIEYKDDNGGIRGPYISKDGGKTWGPNTSDTLPTKKWVMPNGKHFLGFVGRGAHPMPDEWWNRYTPANEWYRWKGDYHLYFAGDLERNDDTIVKAQIYDPETGETETYEPTINWPHMPIIRHSEGRIFPLTQAFGLSNCSIMQDGGEMYIVLYAYGFDSTAPTKEDAVNDYNRYFAAYVFSSSDCARTWNYVSQISVTDDIFLDNNGFEGVCEPMLVKVPDGSFVMVFRTGPIHTSYIVRSTDNCRTWTKPAPFDTIGVFPQLLPLECGVTLASYGRPELRLRATADPAGMAWEDPITIPLSDFEGNTNIVRSNVSCFYTRFVPIDDHSALWVYTEFLRPNENGDPAKAVLVRTVTVVED